MMNQTQSQNPSETANTILKGVAKSICPDNPPTPTLRDIQDMAIATPEPERNIAVASTGLVYRVIDEQGEIRKAGGIASRSREIIGDTVSDWDTLPPIHFVDKRDLPKVLSCISRHIIRTAGEPSDSQVEWLHNLWEQERQEGIKHPLVDVVQKWQINQTHRTTQTATVDHVQKLTTIPYVVSEVTRRKWEITGSVDAIEVDGEPMITHINALPGNVLDDAKILKPQGTKGELMPMPTQRDNMEIPVPLVAYQKYGRNLRSALTSDVAQLTTIAYATNQPLILSVKNGASLLARGEDGKLRPPQPSDEQRFENAYAVVSSMAIWITDESGINRFYPLTACDRLSDNRVSIDAASWAKERKSGGWTLTAGGGVAGQNRLKGDTHNNNVWRIITGVEYWLAREGFSKKGEHARISQALVPASGTTGPGNWYTLSWQELMMIAGDVWDWGDKDENWKIYQRFNKVRASLIQDGYQVKKLNTPAEAGDTVEFLFEKSRGRGGSKVKVRATARFVEGARKAKRQSWQTIDLSEWMGIM